MAEGIEVRHARACASLKGERCSCVPTYRANAWSVREGRLLRRTFRSLAEARTWRADALVALRAGRIRAAASPTVDEMITRWLEGAEAGTIRTRSRTPFKPATIRAVREHYARRLKDPFGAARLDELTLPALQEFVDLLDADGTSPSTIEGAMLPLRLIYRWARNRGIVAIDPTKGLELPAKDRGTRSPPAPRDAARLLAAVPERDRAVWATAMLAGLRRGELLALRWEDVDLNAGTLNVVRSWDPISRDFVTPKSRRGTRRVPVSSTLAPSLRSHAQRTDRTAGLVFGRTASSPLPPISLQQRADAAWAAAGLERVTLHSCRHLYASMSIAAGVNAHALCGYMGHAGIQVTYDLYGHLFPGNEAEASALLDAYLERQFRLD